MNKKAFIEIPLLIVFIILFIVFAISLNSTSEKTLTITDGTHFIDISENELNFNNFESLNENEGLEINGVTYTKYNQVKEYYSLSTGDSCSKHSTYYENKNSYDWCSMSSAELKSAFESERSAVDRYYSDSNCGEKEGEKYKYYDNYKGYSYAWSLIQSNYIDMCSGGASTADLETLKLEFEHATVLYSHEILQKQDSITNLTTQNSNLNSENEQLKDELFQLSSERDLIIKVQESNKQKQEQLTDLSTKITDLSNKNLELKKVNLNSYTNENGGFINWILNLF